MRAGVRVLLVLAVCATIQTAAAQPEDPQLAFAAGSSAFAAGEYQDAAAWFQAALDAGLDEPAVHFNLAVSRYRHGDYAAAQRQFQAIAQRFPELAALATYNLGLTLVRLRRNDDAADAFDAVRSSADADPALVAMAEQMLVEVAPGRDTWDPGSPDPDSRSVAVQRGSWSRQAVVDVTAGYDSNVLLVDEALLDDVGDGGSAYLQAFAWLAATRAGDGGPRFNASAYLVRYPDARTYDQNIARLAAAYRIVHSGWHLDPGLHLSFATLDGDGFERRTGFTFDARSALGDHITLGLRATIENVTELDDQFAWLAGRRVLLRAALDQTLRNALLQWSVDVEHNRRDDPGVSPRRTRAAVRYRQSLSGSWEMRYGLAYRISRYSRLPVARSERLTELTVGGLRPLADGWYLAVEARRAFNASRDPLFDYHRSGIEIGLQRAF